MSAPERAASAVNTGHLVWTGGNVTYALPRVLQPRPGTGLAGADNMNRALMYAPRNMTRAPRWRTGIQARLRTSSWSRYTMTTSPMKSPRRST